MKKGELVEVLAFRAKIPEYGLYIQYHQAPPDGDPYHEVIIGNERRRCNIYVNKVKPYGSSSGKNKPG